MTNIFAIAAIAVASFTGTGIQADGSIRVVDEQSHKAMCDSEMAYSMDRAVCYMDAERIWN